MNTNFIHTWLKDRKLLTAFRSLAIPLVLITVLLVSMALPALPTSAGGSFCSSAQWIPLDNRLTGSVERITHEDDWYKVDVPSSGTIDIEIDNGDLSSTRLALTIFEHGCSPSDSMGIWPVEKINNQWVRDLAVTTGYYYLCFTHAGSESGNCPFNFEVFWEPPCDVTLLSPNGGQNWELGSTKQISWTSSGASSNVKIELCKGTSPYQTIDSGTPNDGSYSWTIPLTYDEYSSYKIKITDTSDSSCNDYSDNYFALYEDCSVTVTSPNGGQNWELGSTKQISWTSSGASSNVKIELCKGTSPYQTIDSGTPNDGSYSWTIPLTYDEYSSYKIKITDTSDSSCNDYSDGYLTLYTPHAPELYGTTIITHGAQKWGVRENWTNDMADEIYDAIYARAGLGSIWIYNIDSGSFDFDKGNPAEGETILVFDWADQSYIFTKGFSEAAGDALFTALLIGESQYGWKLENLHFIGHSRGCTVNSEAVERLLKRAETLGEPPPDIHVTNLDPHDWGVSSVFPSDYDVNPNLEIPEPAGTIPNSGIVTWDRVIWADTYYADGPGLDGRWVQGTYNLYLGSEDHSYPHEWYKKTIKDPDIIWPPATEKSGYYYSRLGGGFENHPPLPDTPTPTQFQWGADGIVNGDFDYGSDYIPGWDRHEGGGTGLIPVVGGGYLQLYYEHSWRKHSRFYIPAGVNQMQFRYQVGYGPDPNEKFKVWILSDVDNIVDEVFSLPLKSNTGWIDQPIDIPEHAGKIRTIKFEIVDNKFADIDSTVLIDNVRFVIGSPPTSNSLIIQAFCPIDLSVEDPDGMSIDKQSSEIIGATYAGMDINDDGDLDDIVTIPNPKDGDYQITVIPELGASPLDTYSLEVINHGITTVLADNVQINNIPSEPYIFESVPPHNWHFTSGGLYPRHLPDGYNDQVVLSDIDPATIPDKVQSVYWFDCNALEWRFWAPGAPGCTLPLLGGGHTFDYFVSVTGPCDWEIPITGEIPTPTPPPFDPQNWSFCTSGLFPWHLPDSYNGQVMLDDLVDVPPEVQGVYWHNGTDWLFWAPGAPGCTLHTLGGGDTYDYMVAVSEVAKEIKIGVIGPMQFQMGEHHWLGATLAANEINAAGGIQVGSETYRIKLVQVDSNELVSVPDAASAAERAITVDNVDFLIGTTRSEASAAVQEVAMDHQTIFLVCGASARTLAEKVAEDYDRYKYWFRVTPVDDRALAQVSFLLVDMVAQEIVAELGIEPKVAVLAEKASWTEPIVATAQAVFPSQGIEVVGVWQPSDKATDVTAELTAIKDSGANMIMTALSGPVGIPYARAWEELEIPAASVGINVMAQADDFFTNTGGFGDYEMTLNIYALNVSITDQTLPFIEAFIAEQGETPTYNAGTYDAVYLLKEALEATDSLDADDLVVELEGTDRVTTAGRLVFNDMHDVTWGPGYVTALGVQWQDGQLKGVWPPADGSWYEVQYPGIVDYQLPPWVVEFWSQPATPMVVAGVRHTVGLKSDGTVVNVGNNDYGQRDVDSWNLLTP